METKYFKIEGLSVALKMVILPNSIKLYKWTNGEWVTASSEYSEIFTGDLPVDEIQKGDKIWTQLGLQE